MGSSIVILSRRFYATMCSGDNILANLSAGEYILTLYALLSMQQYYFATHSVALGNINMSMNYYAFDEKVLSFQ
jgi:hypothetical protein